MLNIEKDLKDEFLNYNNKKIKEENVKEYLNSLKNEELTRFAIVQVLVDCDYSNLFKVKGLNNRPKKYIIEYIIQNLNNILGSYIKIIKTNELEQLKFIIKNNNKEIKYENYLVTLHFINILKQYSLAKVEYNQKKDTIKIYMPKEYIKIFNKALKNEKILEENKYNNYVFEYVGNVVNTYGIVTLKKLHELFCIQMFKIEDSELQHIIAAFTFCNEVYMYDYEEDILVCGLEFFDEDDAIEFYSKQKMSYKKYSKDAYKKISNFEYLDNLKSYKKFINHLCRYYDGISNDLEFIREFIVINYISMAQLSIEKADDSFRTNIIQIFEADNYEIENLLKLVKNIFMEYPKWLKRGNI